MWWYQISKSMTDIHARMLAKLAFVVTQIKKNGIIKGLRHALGQAGECFAIASRRIWGRVLKQTTWPDQDCPGAETRASKGCHWPWGKILTSPCWLMRKNGCQPASTITWYSQGAYNPHSAPSTVTLKILSKSSKRLPALNYRLICLPSRCTISPKNLIALIPNYWDKLSLSWRSLTRVWHFIILSNR